MKAIGGLAADGKLKDCCSLATSELRHQHPSSIREFNCVVVPIAEVRVYGTKLRDAEAGALRPNPPVIEFNVFFEGQFGTREEAHGYLPIVLGGKAASGRVSKAARDEFLAHFGGARLYGVHAVVTHRKLLSRGNASAPGLAGALTGSKSERRASHLSSGHFLSDENICAARRPKHSGPS
jgi:hypothetical protein